MKFRVFLFAFLASTLFHPSGLLAEEASLRVMTFNVRYGTAKDGVNEWANRRDLMASRIKNADPDLLGLQEALDFQNEFLLSKLPEYTSIGVGRDDGDKKGEFATIFYRQARFTAVSSGTFWLSETPEVAGSKGWDAAHTRIVTWARLKDSTHGNQEMLWLNTHFDQRGKQARVESAHILRHFIEKQGAGLPVIVTGDFNEVPDSETYKILLDGTTGGPALTDAFLADPERKPDDDQGTAHGFRVPDPAVARPPMKRIDWIFNSPAFSIGSVTIDRYHEGPVFPSDHYPVIAKFSWK